MEVGKPITTAKFFSAVADLLQVGCFHSSNFDGVIAAINTLRQLSARAKQQEKNTEAPIEEPKPVEEIPQ